MAILRPADGQNSAPSRAAAFSEGLSFCCSEAIRRLIEFAVLPDIVGPDLNQLYVRSCEFSEDVAAVN
jgi:hypothetical protein